MAADNSAVSDLRQLLIFPQLMMATYVIARPQTVALSLGMVVHSEQKTEIYGGGIAVTLTAPHPFMVLLSFKAMMGSPWAV